MILGHLKEIWRYPVKSMGGEAIDSTLLTSLGIPGDRCWAVIDTEKREIRNAKKWPALLQYRARHLPGAVLAADCYDADVPDVLIETPQGAQLSARDPGTGTLLGESLGRLLRLAPRAHPSDREHYRLASAPTVEEFSQAMALQAGEAAPDFSEAPPDLLALLKEYATPPGAYFDAFPLHLLTTDSLAHLAGHTESEAAVQRFRPNLLVEATGVAALTENGWVGARIRIGEAVLRVDSRTVRCGMTIRAQPWCGVTEQKGLMRSLVDHCERCLGVNIVVERAGRISVGCPLTLLEPE
ncbi:MOSC domain-containing protein [Denitratisoma oestradiolicum]|uniref:MOSC domain-containing protein n=1 Tax=Denitratisoma oestradiolicum TaxID=311182 RepID=A0A6S6Y3Y4_9PROT|nr:MOSC N-terminal beta barrel domain-containing protein [Denitratisoma oestradiolicum]TWO80148.1 hypothetical protein CBW56_11305 [Denitratisoma oestradiolicum]CAB1370010.1 MOSC domain-containing protein [Denitratisoma oestradiolicum]